MCEEEQAGRTWALEGVGDLHHGGGGCVVAPTKCPKAPLHSGETKVPGMEFEKLPLEVEGQDLLEFLTKRLWRLRHHSVWPTPAALTEPGKDHPLSAPASCLQGQPLAGPRDPGPLAHRALQHCPLARR